MYVWGNVSSDTGGCLPQLSNGSLDSSLIDKVQFRDYEIRGLTNMWPCASVASACLDQMRDWLGP